jgi:RimJ/RimL family protein N-acetyltransferase
MSKHKRIYFRKTNRVGLSVNFGGNDFQFLMEHMNNVDVTQYLTRRFPLYPGEEREWLENVHKNVHTDQVFGIALVSSGQLIGTMGLHRIDWINRVATTGAWIAAPEHRGKGYGTQAKMLLLDYAFNTLMLRKIRSNVLATNKQSLRYNEKCGYKVEGTLKKQVAVYGDFVDEVCMSVFSEDFAPLWKDYQKK